MNYSTHLNLLNAFHSACSALPTMNRQEFAGLCKMVKAHHDVFVDDPEIGNFGDDVRTLCNSLIDKISSYPLASHDLHDVLLYDPRMTCGLASTKWFRSLTCCLPITAEQLKQLMTDPRLDSGKKLTAFNTISQNRSLLRKLQRETKNCNRWPLVVKQWFKVAA